MRRKTWALVGAAVLLAVATTAAVMAVSARTQATTAANEPPPNTAPVVRGKLSAVVSLEGTLTHRARSDGSPYSVINQANGTYTQLPDPGDRVSCGDVIYRVHDEPVLLLCGSLPAYRNLKMGDVGNDVRQLNQNLHALGYSFDLDADDNQFTSKTAQAVEVLQRDKGSAVNGALASDDAVFLPESVRSPK